MPLPIVCARRLVDAQRLAHREVEDQRQHHAADAEAMKPMRQPTVCTRMPPPSIPPSMPR
jgi:hypothetical protein